MQPLIIILFGRSGCGKGTQAELLLKKFNLKYIGSGSLLRERKETDDFSGRKIKQVLERGGLCPTILIFQLWIKKMEEFKNEPDFEGLIFDGSPRKILEAKLIDEAMEWYEWSKTVKIFLIDISREEAFDRLTKRKICEKCGKVIPHIGEFKNLTQCPQCGGKLASREDDKPSAIEGRLNFFEKDVVPMIEHYQKQGRLIKINGEQSIEKIHQDILEALK